MNATPKFRTDAKISWYCCKVDKQSMNELVQCSDFQGFRQVFLQLALFALPQPVAAIVAAPVAE